MNKKVTIAMGAMTIALATTNKVNAEQTVHVVKTGDTLYGISQKYSVSLSEIREWNGIYDNTIKFGQKIYLKSPYHVVVKGDTLYKIATSKGISVDELKKMNNLSTNDIKIGQKLVILKEISNQEVKIESQEEKKYHVVVKGDTLYKIATQYKMTVNQLKEINQLKDNNIFVGQKLNLKTEEVKKQEVKKEETTKEVVVKEEQKKEYTEYTVEASAYTANCNGCSGITATGINLKQNPNIKVISVDPTFIPLGTKVWVEGYGDAIAADKGSSIKGRKIDVFVKSNVEALQWGRKTVKIKVYK